MPEYRCQQCHASCEADETPSTCPICGAAGEEFLALSSRDSVESLFDLEPLRERPTKTGGEPARLKDRTGSQPSQNDPGNGPLSTTPTLVETSGGLQAATTAELEESELEPASDAPLKAASTLELEDSDLSPSAPPPPMPEAPATAASAPPPSSAVPTSTGVSRLDLLGGRLSSGLSSLSLLRSGAAAFDGADGRETVDLDESDLEQVNEGARPPATPAQSAPAAPAPPAPAAGTAGASKPLAVSPRSLRGRVAFPMRADQTPAPSTLPKEVNELAVTGEPPMPARRTDRPLTGQTESLSSIQARKRRRALVTLGICALAAAALSGIVVLAGSRGADPVPPENNLAPDQGMASRAPDRGPPSPDLSRPDLSPPDLPPPDLAAKRRPVAPGVAKKPERARPDAGPAPSANAKAEAQAAYQDGLRRLLQGQNEEAVRLFNQALAKLPRFSLAYRGLGLAYQKLGRKPMARAAFERYLLLQPRADDADAIRARLDSLKD